MLAVAGHEPDIIPPPAWKVGGTAGWHSRTMNAGASLYDTLHITPAATSDDIKAAWRARSAALHPDAVGDSSRLNEFLAAKDAYETLRDPVKRAAYDEQLGAAAAERQADAAARREDIERLARLAERNKRVVAHAADTTGRRRTTPSTLGNRQLLTLCGASGLAWALARISPLFDTAASSLPVAAVRTLTGGYSPALVAATGAALVALLLLALSDSAAGRGRLILWPLVGGLAVAGEFANTATGLAVACGWAVTVAAWMQLDGRRR